MKLTIEELKLLLNFFADEYISYENLPLIELIRKIRKYVEEK